MHKEEYALKHPLRDRLMMLLYALASLCTAAALIAMVFGRITPDMISGLAAQIRALPAITVRIAMIVCAVLLVIFGLAMINAMFPPKKKRSSTFAIQQNENGMVRISLKTIDALVQKCLGQHSELKVVTSSLFSDEETVRVDVHIALLTDISMPLAISALQKQITKYVEACSGVTVREVRVFVDGALAGGEKAAQSKYALPASILVEESEAQEPALEIPAVEEAPAIEEAPEAAETSVIEEEAPAEDAPVITEEAAGEDAPAVLEAAEAQQTPAEEEAPVTEEAPAAQEEPAQEPVPEKKKLFGFLNRK